MGPSEAIRACLSLRSPTAGAVNPLGNPMPLANTDPPRTAAPDDANADVEGHAYGWYDPDSADFDRADRWEPVEVAEDDEAATLDDG